MAKYYIILKKYLHKWAGKPEPSLPQVSLAVTGSDWTRLDKEDLYEYSGVISTGHRDESDKVLYDIYEMSERYLTRFITDDCIEVKDKGQFDLLAKLFYAECFKI
jgi:hypothetical protein